MKPCPAWLVGIAEAPPSPTGRRTIEMKSQVFWLAIFLAGASPALAQKETQATSAITFEEVLLALRENNLTAEEIRTTDEIDRLEVVDLSKLNSDQALALEETLENTEDGFAEVQTALVTNELFGIELERRSVDIRRIFAATATDDGTVTVYMR
jgi:hypothetical protein